VKSEKKILNRRKGLKSTM